MEEMNNDGVCSVGAAACITKSKKQPREVVFKHKARGETPRMLILALYPPSDSVEDKEHANKTSRAIYDLLHHYGFLWNDIFPFAPENNDDMDQKRMQQLVKNG